MSRALAVFAVAAVVFTWPTAAHLDEHLLLAVSSPFDAFIYLWNFDWLREALGAGASPLRTDRLSYPEEIPLALYTPTYLYALLSLPVQAALPGERGLYLAFHLCVLVSFTLAGLGCYWLARHNGLERAGSLVAGVAFAYCAARMTNLARLNALGSELLPFALLGLQWSCTERRVRGPVLLAAACTALAYNSATHLATTSVALAVFCALTLRGAAPGSVGRIGAAALASLVLVSPLVPGFLDTLGWPPLGSKARVVFSLDLTSLVWPNAADLWLGGLLPPRPTNYLEAHFSFFPGITVWVLLGVAIALRAPVRHRGVWAAMTLVGAILALGPEAKLLEVPTGVSLPYAWLEGVLPPLGITRVPARFVVVFSLGAALLCGAAMDALVRRWRLGSAGGTLLAIAVAAMVGLDGTEGLPLASMASATPQRVPMGRELGAPDPDAPGAVLDLPFDIHHTQRLAMFHQLEHRRPLLFADYPRAPRENVEQFRASALFALLSDSTASASQLAAGLGALDLRRERRQLGALGIDAIVLHHDFYRRVVGASDPRSAELVERGAVLEAALGRAWGVPKSFDASAYEVRLFGL